MIEYFESTKNKFTLQMIKIIFDVQFLTILLLLILSNLFFMNRMIKNRKPTPTMFLFLILFITFLSFLDYPNMKHMLRMKNKWNDNNNNTWEENNNNTKRKRKRKYFFPKIAIQKREVFHTSKWTRKNCSTQKKLINTLITLKATGNTSCWHNIPL